MTEDGDLDVVTEAKDPEEIASSRYTLGHAASRNDGGWRPGCSGGG